MSLLKTQLRRSGSAAIALGIWLALSTTQPDIRISGDGNSVAVRGADGLLHFLHAKADAFVIKDWLNADGDSRASGDSSLTSSTRCDGDGCTMPLADGRLVALTLKPAAFADDCEKAAVIITQQQPPRDCAAMMFNSEKLAATGSVSMRERGGKLVVDVVRPSGRDRPWARKLLAEADEIPAPSRAAPRPADATPAQGDLSPDDQ